MTNIKLLHSNTRKHLTVCKQISFGSFKKLSIRYVYKSYLIYMYKEDSALNNQQWLICHKIQPNQIMYI